MAKRRFVKQRAVLVIVFAKQERLENQLDALAQLLALSDNGREEPRHA